MKLLQDSENIIVFNQEKDNQTLEEFLLEDRLSSRYFKRLYRGKNIFVNGVFYRKNDLLKKGDIISIRIDDEMNNVQAEPIPLDIIYEDMDLLVLNKQPYMVVHQTKSHLNDTISNGISYYFKTKGIRRKIRFVNRLDMNTSGVLLVAKSPYAHQQLARQFENNQVEKRYLAIIKGVVKDSEGIIDLPIGRIEEKSIIKVVTPEGKKAITKYELLKKGKDFSLLDVQIITGRTHQIRVHLNHIGHPIIGDSLYFRNSEYIDRQALHSYYLRIKLPRTQETIELEAPMPEDMMDLVNRMD